MKIRLITNGILESAGSGYNPQITEAGLDQILAIRNSQLRVIPWPTLIVVGTGLRFRATYRVIASFFPQVSVSRSPFLGTADAFHKDGGVAVEDGKTSARDYIGMVGTKGFDAWKFLDNFPPNTLLCGGEEFMYALGLADIFENGRLFELDTETKTGLLI